MTHRSTRWALPAWHWLPWRYTLRQVLHGFQFGLGENILAVITLAQRFTRVPACLMDLHGNLGPEIFPQRRIRRYHIWTDLPDKCTRRPCIQREHSVIKPLLLIWIVTHHEILFHVASNVSNSLQM